MSEWISVEDRLPEDGISLITCSNHGKYGNCVLSGWCSMGGIFYGDNESKMYFYQHTDEGGTEISNVTHWMPLPEPPKDKN